MANVIRHKTKTSAGAPAAGDAVTGQIILNFVDMKMYIKKADGSYAEFNLG